MAFCTTGGGPQRPVADDGVPFNAEVTPGFGISLQSSQGGEVVLICRGYGSCSFRQGFEKGYFIGHSLMFLCIATNRRIVPDKGEVIIGKQISVFRWSGSFEIMTDNWQNPAKTKPGQLVKDLDSFLVMGIKKSSPQGGGEGRLL